MTGILLLGIAHGLSDAAAGFAVGVLLQMGSAEGGLLIFIYNGLAFGLQPIAGLVLDRLKQAQGGASLGLILSSIGLAVFWSNPRPGILLIGLGSAFFHAGGGAVSILNSPGKASGPGVFAAFGVIGLVIGTRLSFMYTLSMSTYFAAGLVILAIAAMFIRSPSYKLTGKFELSSGLEIPVILIVAAFALRSLVWTGVDKVVDSSTYLALLIGLSAGIGKLVGGFLSDRIGWLKWTFLSLTGAAFLLAFARDLIISLLIGIFLLQSVTGLTISWLGRMLPDSPAFAASLALGAAVLVGGLPFAFTNGVWFGGTAILISLPVSLFGYWLVLREKVEKPLLN
jgi:MFS transporter, FSR family, fosmidomycin resistance protein